MRISSPWDAFFSLHLLYVYTTILYVYQHHFRSLFFFFAVYSHSSASHQYTPIDFVYDNNIIVDYEVFAGYTRLIYCANELICEECDREPVASCVRLVLYPNTVVFLHANRKHHLVQLSSRRASSIRAN